ncbi:MAG: hypothetical protein Kapaf2KO_15830 [Candidatus Kapaibacteriales bacterium]
MDNPLTNCSKYPDWYFSLNFGTTFSNMIYTGEIEGGSLEGNFDYKTGFNVGLLFDFYLVKHRLGGDHNSYAIRTGLNYIRKGYQGDNIFQFTPNPSNDEPLISYKTHYDYLQIPVNLVYRIGEINYIGFDINGGGYFGLLVNATETSAIQDISLNDQISNRFEYGVNGGTRVYYYTRIGLKVGLSYNYQLGFYDPLADNYLNSTHLLNISLETNL